MKREQPPTEHIIIRAPLEDVMHESFMPYAEYVILERALPRVEDGLKPVQRRILYAMFDNQIFPDTKHKKCARIVGDTMGRFHPHGDTSIYDALARMAQDFSMGSILVDGQGNFGSIDGDNPAAMRYTEARLSPIAMELLSDIEKQTVPFALNFDDTAKEPVMLPAKYPNILVNGATGIAVGLATNIPPHDLKEVIAGTVFRLENPDCELAEVMKYIKAPDFPTGGIIQGEGELIQAYQTGRGRISLRAKAEIERDKKTRIVVTELPYEVRESAMLKKIEALRESKKELFAGIDNIRSETDRTGIRAVIELKKDINPEKMLDLLYKYSDLQVTYGINMVAIADGQPRQMGLLEILDYYIEYQRKVMRNRVMFDIEQAQEREHKLQGLIKAVLDIDLVIKIVRTSDDTKIAKTRLMEALDITGIQAQAILDLRLARLTKLEIITLEREYAEIVALMEHLNALLKSSKRLDASITGQLTAIAAKYGGKRRTKLSQGTAEIVIDTSDFIASEDCFVLLTRVGDLKRMSERALIKGKEAGEPEVAGRTKTMLRLDTAAKLQLYTNRGNVYTISADWVKECKYKDNGAPLTSLIAGTEKDECVLSINTQVQGNMLFVTKSGLVKLSELPELQSKKQKMLACGLKEGDELILAEPILEGKTLLLTTKLGMSINFEMSEVSVQGRSGKGVTGIKLGAGDNVILAAQVTREGNICVMSDLGFSKLSKIGEYETQSRAGKGLKTFQFFAAKSANNGSHLIYAGYFTEPTVFSVEMSTKEIVSVSSADLPLEPRYSKGEQMVLAMMGQTAVKVWAM